MNKDVQTKLAIELDRKYVTFKESFFNYVIKESHSIQHKMYYKYNSIHMHYFGILIIGFVGGGGVGGGGVSGGGVGGGGVGGSGFVGGLIVVVLGVSVVLDVGHVTGVAVHFVGDGLSASVGQKNVVRAGHDFAVAVLVLTKVVVGVIILDLIAVVVRTGGLFNQQSITRQIDKNYLHVFLT